MPIKDTTAFQAAWDAWTEQTNIHGGFIAKSDFTAAWMACEAIKDAEIAASNVRAGLAKLEPSIIESIDVKTALEVYRKENEKNQRWWTNTDPSREAGFVYGFRCALAVVKDRLGITDQGDAEKQAGIYAKEKK